MRKKWFRQILWRRIFVILLLLLQGLVLIRLIGNTSRLAQGIGMCLTLISILVALPGLAGDAAFPGAAPPDSSCFVVLWYIWIVWFERSGKRCWPRSRFPLGILPSAPLMGPSWI